MITINQCSSANDINGLLIKYGTTEVSLNKQLIEDDIKKLTKELARVEDNRIFKTSMHKKNLKAIISYLENLSKKADKESITINWGLDKNVIRSYPIEIKNIPEYKIMSTDYINLDNQKMICLDYTELADIIAYELMYRDLGETNEAIEEKLKNIGIITVNNSNKINSLYDGESPYKLSNITYIESSPYLIPDDEEIQDYFGNKRFKATSYREVVSYSCRSAIAIILEELLRRQTSTKFKICGVFENYLYLMVGNNMTQNQINNLVESVCIRAFGRKIEVKPKVQVY